MTYQFFSHAIDSETHFCTQCGRFLMDLQEKQRWIGNEVTPACPANVTAISHLVRRGEHREQERG